MGWVRVQEAGPAALKAQVVPILGHWKTDSDLAGIRDQTAVSKLPDEERAALVRLWAGVEEVRAKAAGSK